MIKKSENKLFGRRKKETAKKKASIAPKVEPELVAPVQYTNCLSCRKMVNVNTLMCCANCGMNWCKKCGPTTRCPSCGKTCFA